MPLVIVTPPSFCRRPISGVCRAFTIIELLVVVVIIVVLVGILLPMVNRIRETSRSAICLGNCRELAVFHQAYYAQHNGQLIDYAWYTPSNPQVAWQGFWIGALETLGADFQLRACPSVTQDSDPGGKGTAIQPWSGLNGAPGSSITLDATHWRQGSYGHNGHLYSINTTPFPSGSFGERISQVPNPGNVPAFYDSTWVDSWMSESYTPPPNLNGNIWDDGSANQMIWRATIARHGHGINVGFCDGSARHVDLSDLLRLSWGKGWVPEPITLPSK